MSALREYIDDTTSGWLEAANQQFTINPVKARTLLAEYQFQQPGDFLIKFVQASTLAAHGLTIVENQSFG